MESPSDPKLTRHPVDGPSRKPSGSRITPEGSAILRKTFYEDGITHPDKEMRDDLVRRIQALPGCETYNINTLHNWFAYNRRQSAKRKDSSGHETQDVPSTSRPSSSTLKIKIPKARRTHSKLKLTQYPSINPMALGQLATLVRESPYPSQQLMSTWAQLLKAEEKDIAAWVRAQQERAAGDAAGGDIPAEDSEQSEDEEALSALYNTTLPLPTPSSYPTPTQPHLLPRINFDSPSFSAFPSAASLFAPLQLHNPPPPPPTDQLLLAISSKADLYVGAAAGPTEHPRTGLEFATLFKPYQVEMENLLSIVENPETAKKGKKRVLELWGFPMQGRRPEQ